MKVLLLSHGSGPYGAERILLELARRLPGRGHDVVLALPHEGPAVEMARRISDIELVVCGTPRLPRNVREGIAYFLGVPAAILVARRLIRRVNPDVVWVNSLYNPWGATGALLAGSPVIWHLHERSLPAPAGPILAAIVRWTTDRAVAVSDFVADTFRAYPWLRSGIDVLHNPLLHETEPPVDPPRGPFTVGYVGQLEPRKRAVDFVRALALLPEDVRGVLVGDGKARPAVEAEVRRHGIEHRVELTGYREDVPAQLARLHCLVMPAVREPFGLVVLEAMARGVPVVAARSGALPEVLGSAGLFHEPQNSDDLARQIARLLDDATLRADLATRGRARAAAFGVERWMDAVDDLLEETAATEPPLAAGTR